MSTLTKEQVMAKLQKLLTLAGNKGATEAEMNTAMAKAKALAIEHNVDLSSVDADGEVKVEEMETDFAEAHTTTKQEQPYHLPIIDTITQCFGVKPILSTFTDHNSMRHITRITWVGEKTDLAMAVFVWGWLQTLFPKCWGEYRKAYGIADNYVSKRSYFYGLRDGLINANKRAEDALPSDVRNRYALVVANKNELVANRFKQMFPNTGKVNAFQTRGDAGAKAAGFAKGSTIKLNGGIAGAANRGQLAS